MKNIILFIGFSLCLNSNLFGQNEVQGVWLVCDSTEICEDESLPLYMIISDSTMAFVFSMSTGLDPEIMGLMHYKISNTVMETVDTTAGKIFVNHFDLVWKGRDELHLIDHKKKINMYLFRKEE